MANYSKFLSLISGAERTVDLSLTANVLELGGGGFQMDGSTSGHVVINASATTSTYSMVWPAAQAASMGYVLTNDGTGVLSWAAPAATGVTAISIASSNGFAGSSSGGSTPILTLTTTLTSPVVAANGTALIAGTTTGTGSTVVLATSPTLITPALGTPSAVILTNGTALPLTTGVTGILPIANGGTNASTAATAFANLSPMTTAGDIVYENATPAPARLAIGSTGNVLTVVGGLPVWAPPASGGTVTTVSVVSTNGFAGTVATATSTPAITIQTTVTAPVLAGNGTAIIAGTTTGTGSTVALSASPTFTGTVTTAAISATSGSFSSAINMNSNQINNLANGTLTSDAINLGQLQAAISGLYWQGPAQAYAASNVPLTGGATLTIDGYSVQNGNLVILGNQTTASQNGEYTASGIGSAYVLTPNGLPTAAGDAWLILNGTIYSDTAFVANAAVPAATFTEFAGPTAYTFTAPITLTGRTVSITQATTSTDGYLSSVDWNTFNNKQPAGSYITALTGDGTATGPGSAAFTLATVNTNVGSFGSSTSIPSFTVNAKGLITAASGNAVVAPAGTLSGTTLNSTVVSSSLTSVGTITTGVWNGTAIAIANGGTGQTTQTSAFDALSPLTTAGDTLYYNGTHNVRLGIGSTGQVLTVVGGEPAWAAPSISPSSIALTDNHILVGNASNLATDVAMSGDVAIVASGATSLVATSNATLTTLSALTTASSLASVGTITSGTWNGTTVAIAHGGTGQVTAAAAYNALSPMTTTGDIEYESGTNTAARLPIGSTGNVLTVVAGIPAWAAPAASTGILTTEVSGQALSASTLYAMRYELSTDSGTVGQMWKADNNAATTDNFYVIGLTFPSGSVSIGGAITVVEAGLINVPSHGFTTGAPLFLGASGACTSTAPSTAGLAVVRVGQVKDANNIWVNIQVVGVN